MSPQVAGGLSAPTDKEQKGNQPKPTTVGPAAVSNTVKVATRSTHEKYGHSKSDFCNLERGGRGAQRTAYERPDRHQPQGAHRQRHPNLSVLKQEGVTAQREHSGKGVPRPGW
mmetsp:Transcript_3614/g.6272  ORF Transcript_3614/g.6272 Transcript_3614/m.6272 type:complete len:113 (+) Transcript_3614:2444-2782(+)